MSVGSAVFVQLDVSTLRCFLMQCTLHHTPLRSIIHVPGKGISFDPQITSCLNSPNFRSLLSWRGRQPKRARGILQVEATCPCQMNGTDTAARVAGVSAHVQFVGRLSPELVCRPSSLFFSLTITAEPMGIEYSLMVGVYAAAGGGHLW